MQIKDDAAWASWTDSNTDPYGKAVIDYAERWANLMEVGLAEGQSLADIAGPTSHEADTEGITGFMYGMGGQRARHHLDTR
jgi:hypothetical protein